MRPRILFVAMANSVHAVRWINQLAESEWDIHLFPSIGGEVHSALRNTAVHDCVLRPEEIGEAVRLPGAFPWPFKTGRRPVGYALTSLRRRLIPSLGPDQVRRLASVVRRLKPDIVHSLELQHAGYLTLEARRLLGGRFPPWIVTNWGSDIYLFGRLPEHANRIRTVLETCDYYGCECDRDVQLGRMFGFKGEVLPVLPNGGGYDLAEAQGLRMPGLTSARRLVVLKGYQGWAGRGLFGLRALELAADALRGYEVAVYLTSPDVEVAARLFEQSTSIPVRVVPFSPQTDILRLHGRARVSIGLSISDAISTSLLEAILMGSFPIQSCTACAEEWIEPGRTGFVVPPEDPQAVAAAIREALSDDTLVDHAAAANSRVAVDRLDREKIRPQVIATYKKIASAGNQPR
jgi:glycosyltransferase involved in cell wall biosynthesis